MEYTARYNRQFPWLAHLIDIQFDPGSLGGRDMKDNFTMIRKYQAADIDAVVSIWRLASEFAHPFLTTEFLDQEENNLRNIYVAVADTWVTEIDDHVVGFIALVENEIGGLFLDPAYHGQGLGKAMVDMAVAEEGTLTVEVFRENAVGRGFYDRYGFKILDEYFHEPSGQVTIRMSYPGN